MYRKTEIFNSIDEISILEIPTNNKKFKNLLGDCFDRLIVIGYAGSEKGFQRWWCLCVCGKIKKVRASCLLKGNTQSCGCLSLETSKKMFIQHGMYNTKIYRTWCDIRRRCYDPKNSRYHNYGGRGIKVCERWLENFENFYEDMGDKPGPEYSIDRIDVNGDYCKENCKWSTDKEQANNKTNNRYLIFNSEKLTITEFSKRINISQNTIRKYLSLGWTTEEISTKKRKNKN